MVLANYDFDFGWFEFESGRFGFGFGKTQGILSCWFFLFQDNFWGQFDARLVVKFWLFKQHGGAVKQASEYQ